VAGPDITASLPALTPGSTVLGLRFRPGAAANWLGLPLSEIVGRQVDLRELWGRRARDLGNGIGDAATPSEGLAQLQTGLARLAAAIEPPPRDMAMVFHSLGANIGEDGSGVTHLRHRLELSERTLRRRCCRFFGYGPKTLERILRFQRFLQLARAAPKTGLSVLAIEAGYADQAHLSREVRSLSGLSPRLMARQLAG
jgi:AraC-like DNA-binding protein